MFEDIDKSLTAEYAPSLKRMDLNDGFKNSGYSDFNEYKKHVVQEKIKSYGIEDRGFQQPLNKPFTTVTGQDSSGGNTYKTNHSNVSEYEGKYRASTSHLGEAISRAKDVKPLTVMDKLANAYDHFLTKIGASLPDTRRDQALAQIHGIPLKDSALGSITKLLGYSDKKGYNRISGEKINIDYLSNMSNKDLDFWKKMQREEAAKHVRQLGGNIDPFDGGDHTTKGQYANEIKEVRERIRQHEAQTSKPNPKVREALDSQMSSLKEKWKTAPRGTSEQLLERTSSQLREVEKRIKDSENNVKKFFNPIDKEELDALKVARTELFDRQHKLQSGYNNYQINNDKVPLPNSVSESFADLHKRRTELYDHINTGNNVNHHVPPNGGVSRLGVAFPEDELSRVNREIAEQGKGLNAGYTAPSSRGVRGPKHTKEFKPEFGTSGYGLGFKNAMMSSRAEGLTRFAHYMNPIGVGGASGTQALLETVGILNKNQKMMAGQARGFSKLVHNIVPISAAGLLLSDMADNKDANEIASDFLSMGTALQGWRIGTALGHGLTREASLSRFVGLGVGGVAGLGLGYLAGTAIVSGISDVMSNDSSVRKFAKKTAMKEGLVSMPDTYKSLTAKQSSLQKLAKSGLNDRGLLLGNEANVLVGAM